MYNLVVSKPETGISSDGSDAYRVWFGGKRPWNVSRAVIYHG